MKTKLLVLSLLTLNFSTQLFAQRYLSEIFFDNTVTSNVTFGWNYSVLRTDDDAVGFITPLSDRIYIDSLRADIYEPVGDTALPEPR
ncbi:MAG: hypothetical protein JJE25_13365 [Bacteroidia bacterium]|nr:hypothetical protein [Bacteroidia bacterium]